MGYNFPIKVGGKDYLQDGTSGSTPVFAAMLTIINAARRAVGKSAVGSANHALYHIAATVPGVFHDITSGENNCCAAVKDPMCCSEGFTAIAGYDPITGLGSVNFTALRDAFVSLGRAHGAQ